MKRVVIIVGAKKIYDEARKPENRARLERVINNLKGQSR